MGYSVQIKYTIPAAAVIANLLAGTSLDFFGAAAKVTVYASADASGDTHALTLFHGSTPGQAVIPNGPISVGSTAGSVKTNENFVAQFAIPAGARPVLSLAGTAAHVGQYLFVVE